MTNGDEIGTATMRGANGLSGGDAAGFSCFGDFFFPFPRPLPRPFLGSWPGCCVATGALSCC